MNQLIREDLLSDEHMIWAGQPDNSKIFSKGDLFLIPFSIMWGGFAIFWEAMAIIGKAPIFFMLWGIPFVLIGLYMMFGRFFYKSYIRRNTYYYITNKRIIILKDVKKRSIEAEYINTLPCINKDVDEHGKGTVTFGHITSSIGMYADSGMELFNRQNRYGAIAPAFYDIEQAHYVYRIVNEIRNGTYYY